MRLTLTKKITGYIRHDFRHDLIAGIAITAVAIPELMGIATVAGVPVEMGLYSAIFAPIVFALVGSSKRMIVGADSATAVLLFSAASSAATMGTHHYLAIVGIVSLLAGLMLGAVALFRLQFLSDLISRPVMVGVLAGVGLQLIIIKIPEMLGIGANGSVPHALTMLSSGLGHINGMSITIAVLVVGVILIFRRSRVPGPLIALAAAVVFAVFVDLKQVGVLFVQGVPSGIPSFGLPILPFSEIISLIPVAAAVALVILAQSTSVIRTFATEHDDKIRLPRDMFGLGLAGVVSSLTHGFAINGSPPRTLIADIVGMRTQVASVVMSLVIAVVVLFGGTVFSSLPLPALASVVFVMGLYLIGWRELRYMMKTHTSEFVIALIAALTVVGLGVFQGVVVAIILSLMERLWREYHPTDTVLLHDGILSDWAIERVGDVSSVPKDTIIYSFDDSLFFENSSYFIERVKTLISDSRHEVHAFIVDAGAIDNIDYTAVEQLKNLYRQLSSDGIRLGFAHVSPELQHEFDRDGVTDLVGRENIAPTLRAAVLHHPPKDRTTIDRVKALNVPLDQVIVVGGGVMEALNLRDTTDIDVVVSDSLYATYKHEADWKEYTLSTGKAILTHDGVNMMKSWLGRNYPRLKRDAFLRHGVQFMSIEELIACKQRLNRQKDRTDIEMLYAYQRRASH